jgi:hypothetical protein
LLPFFRAGRFDSIFLYRHILAGDWMIARLLIVGLDSADGRARLRKPRRNAAEPRGFARWRPPLKY